MLYHDDILVTIANKNGEPIVPTLHLLSFPRIVVIYNKNEIKFWKNRYTNSFDTLPKFIIDKIMDMIKIDKKYSVHYDDEQEDAKFFQGI
jgi:hypothetical protein